MKRDGYQPANRQRDGYPLAPGERTSPSEFRVRYRCPVGGDECGRPGLQMQRKWAALTVHPHTLAVGDARRHAERLAHLARRNSTESLFSALQVGHHLGTDGANRTRSPKQATHHTLIDLALLLRNAYTLASLRIERNEFPETPPPDLARALWI
ncbi:MAG: hypothetical protein ACKVUT_15350 [Gaiella sp.]